MRFFKIKDESDNSYYTIGKVDDFEFANPIEIVHDMFVGQTANAYKTILELKKAPVPDDEIDAFVKKKAEGEWNEKFNKITSTAIPANLIELLKTTSKNEQVKLLKGISLTSEELIAFIIRAWVDFGFTWSQYRSTFHQTGLDASKLPRVVEIETKDKVNKVGDTDLSDGQLKQAIAHRSVKVAKFLDKEDVWHCFFLSYKSLGGEKAYKDGQPHIHYISSGWGLTREYVLNELSQRTYKLPSLHIDYYTHRNQKEDDGTESKQVEQPK